jgi:hypothetical protein
MALQPANERHANAAHNANNEDRTHADIERHLGITSKR